MTKPAEDIDSHPTAPRMYESPTVLLRSTNFAVQITVCEHYF